ncbi:MAG: sugar ABC transporter permease [Clostridia bacterium]|nr:sugar ABC transporter permease [Clostridia bacterium]
MSNKVKVDVDRREMTKLQWTWHLMKQNWVGYAFVMPFMILFLLFSVIPVVASLFLSLTSYNLIQAPRWVGFSNYINMFLNDDYFMTGLKNTLIFAVATGPGSFFLSFVVAWFINQLQPKARALMTLIFYAPSLTGATAFTIFLVFFAGDAHGYLNGWLLKVGLIDAPVLWLNDTRYIMPICIGIALWMSLGTAFLSFIAGLQGVDHAQYEAGAVDGITNRWQELWYITLPNMKDHLMFGAVMSITGAFGFGAIVTTLAGNPPTDYVGYTLSHHFEEYASNRWEYGYASAIALVIFLLSFGSNILVNKMLKKVGQ